MLRRVLAMGLAVVCATSLFIVPRARAQEPDAGGGARARGGRGSTREFLGLGAAPDPAEAKKGEPLYKNNCASCHGENGRGAQGPNLIRSVVVLHDENDEEIGAVIKNGRAGGMPPFPQLTPAEIHSISQFLKMQVELAANRGTYTQTYGDLRNKVTGDAAAGKAFFDGNCASCHSPTGDLAKIGGKFQQAAQLQQRFLWPVASGPTMVTVTLANGEKVSGALLKWDDFNVSLRDGAGNYRSFAMGAVKVKVDDKLDGHRKLLSKYTNADIHNLTAYLVTLK